ncbi:hypothetical protein MMC24_006853 [Lignoscripta atroalba]|nr:hypothetical protein [Lignoscripta atroalba]
MLFTSTSILVLVSLISIARVNAECIGVGAHPLTVTKRNIHADSDPSLGRDSYVDVSDLHKRQAAEAATAYFCGTLTGPMVADPVVLPTVGNYILSWAGVVGSGSAGLSIVANNMAWNWTAPVDITEQTSLPPIASAGPDGAQVQVVLYGRTPTSKIDWFLTAQ